MSMYKHIRQLWKKPKESLGQIQKDRILQWKKEKSTVRIDRPTRLDRARSVGYRAKQGIILVRQRVMRNKRMRPAFPHGRRPKHMRRKKVLDMNYQWIAETRAQKKFVNCTVLNSYPVGGDGKYFWFEVILVDRAHPAIVNDKQLSWITEKKGRAARGLTSAAKQSTGR